MIYFFILSISTTKHGSLRNILNLFGTDRRTELSLLLILTFESTNTMKKQNTATSAVFCFFAAKDNLNFFSERRRKVSVRHTPCQFSAGIPQPPQRQPPQQPLCNLLSSPCQRGVFSAFSFSFPSRKLLRKKRQSSKSMYAAE